MEMNDKAKANPLRYILQLIKGIVAAMFSSLLVVQLFAIMIYQFNPSVYGDTSPFFLSRLFEILDGTSHIPIFSALIFAAIAFYLTLCFVKGITRFGFRFIMFLEIHPMQIHATPLNSFLFNVLLMVMCVLPQLQFMVFIFDSYTSGSTVDIFFSKTVSNL